MSGGKGGFAPANQEFGALLNAIDAFAAPNTVRPGRVMGAELVELRHACDRLELEFSEVAADFAAADEYEIQGSITPIDWIRHNCRMSGHAAAERVCVGEHVGALPQSTDALCQGQIGLWQGAPAAELEFSMPISARMVERLACDSTITRVLQDATSTVVDVGRARRVVPGSTRRALNVRDRFCQWPGCERPASWSAAHHLVHWCQGGKTDLANLVLLCHCHHWMVHEGGWQIARDDTGRILTIPPPAYLYHARLPRGPDQLAA